MAILKGLLMINFNTFYRIFSWAGLAILIVYMYACTTPEDVGCVPVYIGTGYDDEGMIQIIETEEVGCS